MVLAAVLLGICQILSSIILSLLIRHYLKTKTQELEERAEAVLRDWVESPEDGKPSKLALILDSAGAVVGAAAARSIMASMKQQASSVAEVANGISDQIGAQQNPALALLTGGKRGKGAALIRLAEMLGPLFKNGNGASGGTSEIGSHSVRSRIERGG